MSNSLDQFEIRRYLAPLQLYRSLILTFCAVATLSSLFFTYVVSEKYLATATVLYRPREAVSFQPKTRDAFGFPMPLVALESIGNTLEAVVKSDGLLRQVVQALHLDVTAARKPSNALVALFVSAKDEFKELRADASQLLKYGRLLPKDPTLAAVESLRDNLAIKRTNKAYTFDLQVVDDDPARAARIVDEVARILSDFIATERVKEARLSRERMEPRLRESGSEIAAMRESLERFKTEQGVSSLSEELSLRLKSISSLQDDFTAAQNELAALENERRALNAQLQSEQQLVKYSTTTSDNPLVEQLRLDLARLDVERSGLLERYTSNHQEVRAVDAKIQEVRQRLSREVEKTVSSESVGLNDIYQKVLAKKLANDADIARLTARASSLSAAIQRETALTQRLTQNEPRLNELALQLKSAEESYQLLNGAYEEARLAESKTTSELLTLNSASVPMAPVRPIKILHVATTAVLSVVLAVGFCFFVNAFDNSVRSIEQVENALGLPVLATIPAVKDAGPFSGNLPLRP